MVMGWMLSPEFLMRRESYHLSFEEVIRKASERGVKVNIMLYHESCFLSNGSQYVKEKLEKHENVRVLCHPSGKLPVLWSHHGKIVIVDEREAFIGGLDICYGRYDSQTH